MKQLRIELRREHFANLVRGEELVFPIRAPRGSGADCFEVRLILADIGFTVMYEEIHQAVKNAGA